MKDKLSEFSRVETLEYRSWRKARIHRGVFYIVRYPDSDPPGKIAWVCFRCPCPCNQRITLLVDAVEHSDTWKVDMDTSGKVSLDRSIFVSPCKSHYFIHANRVEWCDG